MGKFLDALKNIGLKVNGKKPTSTTTVAVLNEIAEDYTAPQEALTFDTTPTANSTNPVTSGGIKTYVDGLMNGALKRAIVSSLPTEDIDTNTIYMVLDATAAQGNVYNEYLYINNAWELIGTTATSGGGATLYQHNVYAEVAYNQYCFVTIFNSTNTQLTYNTLYNFLNTNGFIVTTFAGEMDVFSGKFYTLGVVGAVSDNFPANAIFIYQNKLHIGQIRNGAIQEGYEVTLNGATVTDTVVPILQ